MKINSQLLLDKSILLVGDAILDVYIHGVSAGLGLGTNVPRVQETNTVISYGGNGLVARNLLELGGKVFFVSVIGDDQEARYYDDLKHPHLEKYFVVDKTRPTIVKRRIFADGVRLLHLNRADHRDVDSQVERKVINCIRSLVKKVDVVVVMDPQHGLLTKNIVSELIGLGKKYSLPVHIDFQISHRNSNHILYKGGHTIFLNENEVKAVDPRFNILKAEESLKVIQKKLNIENIVVKLGPRGSVAIVNRIFIKTPGVKVKSVDPVGAGDAFLAAFSLADFSDPKKALYIANAWAALSTTIHGTIPPSKSDLVKILKKVSR